MTSRTAHTSACNLTDGCQKIHPPGSGFREKKGKESRGDHREVSTPGALERNKRSKQKRKERGKKEKREQPLPSDMVAWTARAWQRKQGRRWRGRCRRARCFPCGAWSVTDRARADRLSRNHPTPPPRSHATPPAPRIHQHAQAGGAVMRRGWGASHFMEG